MFAPNIDCGYMLEPPCRGSSNEFPQSMFWNKNKKNRYIVYTPKVVNITQHVFMMKAFAGLICFQVLRL